MTGQELKHFKTLLVKRRKDIEEEMSNQEKEGMSSQKDISGDLSGYSFHMADVATDNYNRDFSFNMVTTEQKLIYEIDDALRRIDEKSFGICEGCKKAVNKKRLEIVPYARLCIRCKTKFEKKS